MSLQTLGLPLSLWQTALTSLLSRKAVWAGRLRSSLWQSSFMHAGNTPIPKHSPFSCREPLTPAVFRGASLQLIIPHSSSPRPSAAPWPQVAAGWPQLGTGLFQSSDLPHFKLFAHRLSPSILHLFLMPQILLLLQSVPQQHFRKSYQPYELLFLNICKFGPQLHSTSVIWNTKRQYLPPLFKLILWDTGITSLQN